MDKNVILLIIAATMLFLVLGVFIFSLIFLFQRRRHQHTLEITDMKNKYEAELLKSQLEIQEQTLKTISQEIHDNIGQVLTLAKIQLYSLTENCSQEDLQPTKDLISKSINDLRDLSKSLNPDRVADIGLLESIKYELGLLEKTNLMKTKLEVAGQMQPLPAGKNIIVFRIFQELMNNAIRHSEASLLKVEMDYQPDLLILTLTDNGKGFDEQVKKGIGLASMQTRATMIQAALAINSVINIGTVTMLTVPFDHQKN